MSAPEASRSPLRRSPGSTVLPGERLSGDRDATRGLFPRLFISDRGRTPSTRAVALLLLCLYSGGRGVHVDEHVDHAVDVHVDEDHDVDHFAVGDHRHAHHHREQEHHHFDHFTREEEPPAVATTPLVRREARPTSSTGPSRSHAPDVHADEHHADHFDQFTAEEQTPAVVNSIQYVAREPNGAGVGGGEAAGSRGWGVLSSGSASVELPGITNSHTDMIRALGLTEVRVDEATMSAAEAGEEDEKTSKESGRHSTSEQLTVEAATASSEFSELVAGRLIDNDIGVGSLAHTSDKRADALSSLNEGIGQKCPWWQLDLGATKTVGKVTLSAPLAWRRMRRLLYVLPMTGPPVGEVEYANKPMSDTTGTRQGGVRVLVGNSPRYRAHTSEEYPSGSGRWPGVGMGLICTEPPPTGEECETIRCENPATCLNRFAPVPLEDGTTDYTIDHQSIGTAEVDCNGKQGRYVTIELPGLTASDSDKIRSAGLTEVRVFAPAEETTSVVPFGPAQEPSTTSPPPASAEDTTSIAPLGPAAKTSATSSPAASAARTGPAEDETSIAPLVIGGVVVLAVVVDVVGTVALFRLGF